MDSVLLDRVEDLEENLEYQFLFENDPESIHLLLSMIDLDHPKTNLHPKYLLMKNISRSLNRALRSRKDRAFIIRAIRQMINDDVHRFELAIVLKAYPLNSEFSSWIDHLERIALENFSPKELEKMQFLYQDAKAGKAMAVKSKLYHWLSWRTDSYHDLHRLSNLFCSKVIKKKIYLVNDHLDRQIVLDFDNLNRLKDEESSLTIKDLNFIYRKIRQYMSSNVVRIYKDCIWEAINEAVLERYQ